MQMPETAPASIYGKHIQICRQSQWAEKIIEKTNFRDTFAINFL
jgi:hypothetical protein